ncbi:Hypothetical protein HVIM_04256 [Roseomonas mucosa]|uniref:Uncharacterized protein n=1 Tax=Roseomonas mucosa TaxID=207340 RepID=A0A4Y1MY91_9PROT|nr:Hypothetical protein RADP37_04256 [Roseomonas mucosa]QDD95010.1 Hypothetical protein HVIM_04256 [Roseomonas mucosa]UZO92482.1 Hypothetical protein RMP42_04256 [Roseomonas mucosa]
MGLRQGFRGLGGGKGDWAVAIRGARVSHFRTVLGFWCFRFLVLYLSGWGPWLRFAWWMGATEALPRGTTISRREVRGACGPSVAPGAGAVG